MKPVSIVLLPGLDGTGRLFTPLLNCLPDWIKPVIVSYPTNQALSYEDLHALVAHSLPLGSNFLILGESFSGPLAVMAAADKPEGLIGIVLCATFIKKPFQLLPAWTNVFCVGPIIRFWPATIRLRRMFAAGKDKALIDSALDVIKSVNPNVIAQRIRSVLTVDVEQQLIELDIPILYLQASNDHLIKSHNGTSMKAIRPDMAVAAIDTRHFILQLEPEKAVAEIASFLRRIETQ